MGMRVLISGDREWGKRRLQPIGVHEKRLLIAVVQLIAEIDPDALIIEGEAQGADTLARENAHANQLDHVGVEAKWRVEGRRAGPVRNKRMLNRWKPDVVIWFHHDLTHSAGTAHMVKIANAAGVPTIDGTQRLETVRMMLEQLAKK